jgi:co-chaperonin GroES (HSP10)
MKIRPLGDNVLVKQVKADEVTSFGLVLPEKDEKKAEAEVDPGVSKEDAWDKRAKEVMHMIDDEQDLNNASTSSREQSFIHMEKQKKRSRKKHLESAQDAAEAGFVSNLNKMRKAKLDNTNMNDGQNNGGGMSL